jgi:hypothetical protein
MYFVESRFPLCWPSVSFFLLYYFRTLLLLPTACGSLFHAIDTIHTRFAAAIKRCANLNLARVWQRMVKPNNVPEVGGDENFNLAVYEN